MNETEKYHKNFENYISILNNKNNASVKILHLDLGRRVATIPDSRALQAVQEMLAVRTDLEELRLRLSPNPTVNVVDETESPEKPTLDFTDLVVHALERGKLRRLMIFGGTLNGAYQNYRIDVGAVAKALEKNTHLTTLIVGCGVNWEENSVASLVQTLKVHNMTLRTVRISGGGQDDWMRSNSGPNGGGSPYFTSEDFWWYDT